MSDIHLRDIRRLLERSHWKVVEELPGDDYAISATWVIERPDGTSRFHLDFEGLDDMRTLPIEESYACTIREALDISCYFARQSRSWPQELEAFASKLSNVNEKRLRSQPALSSHAPGPTKVVQILGWHTGANKVEADLILAKDAGLGLARGKELIDSVMEGRTVDFEVADQQQAARVIGLLRSCGFDARYKAK